MKRVVLLFSVMIICLFITNNALSQFSRDLDLEIEKESMLSVEVSGFVPDDKKCTVAEDDGSREIKEEDYISGLFLGVTAIVGGEEKDFAYRIEPVDGKFSKEYSIRPSDFASKGSNVKWVVALYERKVERDLCEKFEGGSPCKYCEENGFHLDMRVTRKTLNTKLK